MRRSQNSYKTPSKSLVATKSSGTLSIACFVMENLVVVSKIFIFTHTWGHDPIRRIFLRWVTPLAVVNRLLSDPRNPYPVVHEMGIPILADIVDYTNIIQYILINAQESLKTVRLYVYQFDRLLGWSAENHPPKNNLTFFRHLGVHEISRNSPEMSALLKKRNEFILQKSQECSNLGHIFSYWILMNYLQYFVRVSTIDWKFRINPL